MIKNILKIIAIFIIATVGGIFADQIFWPYFVERPLFYKYSLDRQPVNIIENKTIIVQENEALLDAFSKAEKAVGAIKTTLKNGKKLEGSGLIISSDGLVVTLAELVPQGGIFSLFFDNRVVSFTVEKRDVEKNLALLKIDEKNLPTVSFGDFSKIKTGQRVFLVSALNSNPLLKTANEGIVKYTSNGTIFTNIKENTTASGSSLFDIEANVLGLNVIDENGRVSAISINTIREFAGL